MIASDDNGNHTVLVDHNMLNPRGLAVDWIHGLLFWVDSGLKTVNVMDLNTKQRKVLFNEATDTPSTIVLFNEDIFAPKAIAVDPSKGFIFWVLMGRIERASMDGNDRMTIVNSSSSFRIALDIVHERVYWADNITKTIASVDYNGNDWRTILLSDTHIEFPYSLTIFEEKLYWTDYKGGVFVMSNNNGTEVRKLISGVDFPNTVRIYHSAVQPELPNKCDHHSCGNGAICLPNGCDDGAICLPKGNSSCASCTAGQMTLVPGSAAANTVTPTASAITFDANGCANRVVTCTLTGRQILMEFNMGAGGTSGPKQDTISEPFICSASGIWTFMGQNVAITSLDCVSATG
uniref:C6 domain-containing protein n=1 Tax=Acrobeloides nanus TaxID=290746 RepID=A0A914DKN1_9BILA